MEAHGFMNLAMIVQERIGGLRRTKTLRTRGTLYPTFKRL